MEFIHLVADVFVLGFLGFACTVCLAIWWAFCDTFIFNRGYLPWVQERGFIKGAMIVTSCAIIWGGALILVHQVLWGGDTAPRIPNMGVTDDAGMDKRGR